MPTAEYEALVDWNADGDYSDTGETVTSRVLKHTPVRLRRGLGGTRAIEAVAAGELTYELNNVSKDYSSLYASSPLYGNVKQGRRTQFWTIPVRDSFDRANNAASMGSPDVGAAWSTLSGTAGINTNQAYFSATDGASKSAAVVDAGMSDVYLEVTFAALATQTRLAFRFTDLNNGLIAEAHTGLGDYRVYKLVAGTYTLLGTLAVAPSAGQVVKLLLRGDSIQLQVGASTKLTVTSSHNQTATKHGIGVGEVNGTLARFNDFKIKRPLLNGTIADLDELPAPTQRSVMVRAVSQIAQIIQFKEERDGGSRYATQLYTDIRTDQAIGYLLDAIGLTDTSQRVFDQGNTVLAHWWLDTQEDVFEALMAIVRAEGPTALFYEDGFGRLVFRSRNSLYTDTRRSTSQATLSSTGSEPLFIAEGYRLARRNRNIVNDIRLTWRKRAAAASLSAVWNRGGVISLGRSESITVEVRAPDPFTGAVNPVASTDYALLSGTLSAATLNRSSGQSADLTLTAGTGGAVIDSAALDGSGIQVRAYSVAVVDERVVAPTISVSASKTAFGPIPYALAVRAEFASFAVAQHVADEIARLYKDGRFTVDLALDNQTATRLERLQKTEIGDRVTVVESQAALNHACQVLVMDHTIVGGGKYHEALLSLEEAPAIVTPFRLDTSQLGPTGTHVMVG